MNIPLSSASRNLSKWVACLALCACTAEVRAEIDIPDWVYHTVAGGPESQQLDIIGGVVIKTNAGRTGDHSSFDYADLTIEHSYQQRAYEWTSSIGTALSSGGGDYSTGVLQANWKTKMKYHWLNYEIRSHDLLKGEGGERGHYSSRLSAEMSHKEDHLSLRLAAEVSGDGALMRDRHERVYLDAEIRPWPWLSYRETVSTTWRSSTRRRARVALKWEPSSNISLLLYGERRSKGERNAGVNIKIRL